VVRHYAERFGLERVALVGYSMGGNLVLKLAGEWGKGPPLCAVAAVCPAVDLAPGADALHEPLNRGYEWRFLLGLMARYRRKAKLFPGIYAPPKAIGPVRSIREFDNKIVARYWGFRDADDYYDRAASARVVDRIAVPTLCCTPRTIPSFACCRRLARSCCQPACDLFRNPPRRPLRLPFPRPRQRDSLGRGDGDALPAGNIKISWKLTGSSRWALTRRV
jgi:pimeloyl-ACP methyl ester carboxylesterase